MTSLLFYCEFFGQNHFIVFSSANAPFISTKPLNVVQDRDNAYWISFLSSYSGGISYPGGVMKLDGLNWQTFTFENSPLSKNSVNAIAIDSVGRKWFATDSGLVKFDGIHWTFYTKQNSPLRENIIWNVSIEQDSIVWISSYSTGFYRFDGLNWTNYNSSNSPFSIEQANFVVIDRNGIKWCGLDYSPLFSFDGTNWQMHAHYPFAPGPGGFYNPDVRALAIDKNNVKWLTGAGYWGSGIPRYYAIAKFIDTTWTVFDSLVMGFQHYSNYFGIAIDTNNIKWIADWIHGLIRYNDTSFYIYNETNSPIRKAYTVNVDKFNNKIIVAEINEQSSSGEYLRGIVFYNENGVVLTSINEKIEQPLDFYLAQNYPNPFDKNTTIMYSIGQTTSSRLGSENSLRIELNQTSPVSLKVYDVLGREIKTLVVGYKTTGFHEITFNAESLPSGIYFYRLRAGENVMTKKMLIIK